MTDLDERGLVRDLHRRPLPAEQPDLGARSVALAGHLRRRRRSAAVAVVAGFALLAGVAWGGDDLRRLGPEPALDVPSPSPNTSALYPEELRPGPAPRVDYVHDGRWIRTSGEAVTLADADSLLTERGDAFVAFDGGLLAVRDLDPGPGQRLGYSRDDGRPARIPGVADPRVLGGAQPGPQGSVLVPVVGGHAVATPDGRWSVVRHLGDPAAPGAATVVAARESLFHAVAVGPTTVVRRSELDPEVPVVDNEQFRAAVASDPASDRVVLSDAQGCQDVRLQSPWSSLAYTCTWSLRSLSGDGRHAVGVSAELGWALVDLTTGYAVVVLGGDSTVEEDSFRFDASGRLQLVIRSDAGEFAVATCTTDVGCWLATPWSTSPYVLVQSNGS